MKTLVDANVLLDVFAMNASWASWSVQQLERAAAQGEVVINPVVYAEFSAGYGSVAQVDSALGRLEVEVADLSKDALFRAGQAYRRYRVLGGPRLSLLPDFLIGAHAEAEGWPLLTRDVRRYRTYFPSVQLITP